MKNELVIVMPVFNEQASIRKVVKEWIFEIENWTDDFKFLVLDDGSTDGTWNLLEKLHLEFSSTLQILKHKNIGHGNTCIKGYQLANNYGAKWVLQIDSDGQCDPRYFFKFWNQKDKYDVIFANRKKREDGFRRVIASLILKTFLFLNYRVLCIDANVPYRLMKVNKIHEFVSAISGKVDLANIALSLLIHKDERLKVGTVDIVFKERYGGEPSVKMTKFAAKAKELKKQLKTII
jgi:glycosyltransferase involved in cell wall biosynthesis